AGAGGATGQGGSANITAGAGGATSGNGGNVGIVTGTPTDGNGGSVTLTTRAGVSTNRSGGAFNIILGAATGTGAPGQININSLLNFANDAAAATGGIAVGGLYRNASAVQVRVT